MLDSQVRVAAIGLGEYLVIGRVHRDPSPGGGAQPPGEAGVVKVHVADEHPTHVGRAGPDRPQPREQRLPRILGIPPESSSTRPPAAPKASRTRTAADCRGSARGSTKGHRPVPPSGA